MPTTATLPPELLSGEPARLFPIAASRQRECHAVSTLLAIFLLIPEYAAMMLEEVGIPIGKRARLHAFTEVCFKFKEDRPGKPAGLPRPDGYLIIETGARRWTALIEAKVHNEELTEPQVETYLELARDAGIDAVITISNQYALLPTHHPVRLSRQQTRNIGLYHFSWLALRSNAQVLADTDSITDREQSFILREFIRFLSDERSGVREFDRMGAAWKDLCIAIQEGKPLRKDDALVHAAVSEWHQLTRYLAVELSTSLARPVRVHILRPHIADPQKRQEADATDLVNNSALSDEFDIPNAASRVRLTANLDRRNIALSMTLRPPLDRKRPAAAINWLTRQLDTERAGDVLIKCDWPGRAPATMERLATHLEYPKVLVPPTMTELPKSLEVIRIIDLANRFRGAKTLVEDVKKAFEDFYANIGQHLKAWTPDPPEFRKKSEAPGTSTEGATEKAPLEAIATPSSSPASPTAPVVPSPAAGSPPTNPPALN